MKIAIASGKGGTGKTTIAGALAKAALYCSVLRDTDVESPNLCTLTAPRVIDKEPVNVPVPVVDQEKCILCRACLDCRFNAIAIVKEQVLVFDDLCRNCGFCSLICPVGAIKEEPRTIGYIEKREGPDFMGYAGQLNVGEQHPDFVIRSVKDKKGYSKLDLTDCPPGTGNEIFISLKGIKYLVLVSEPNRFALADLKLLVENIKEFRPDLHYGVILNKSNPEHDHLITDYLLEEDIDLLTKIPYDREIAKLTVKGIPFLEEKPEYYPVFKRVLNQIRKKVEGL